MSTTPDGAALGGPPTSRADVAPPEQEEAVSRARCAVHRAAAEWPPGAVRLLGALVEMGHPVQLLAALRVAVSAGYEGRRGPRVELPATSAMAFARAEALGLWRSLGVALGVRVLGAPGSWVDGEAAPR